MSRCMEMVDNYELLKIMHSGKWESTVFLRTILFALLQSAHVIFPQLYLRVNFAVESTNPDHQSTQLNTHP